jgi:hypothetical protein|nr:MAG TPA: RNA polymerase sigma factor [Caudoviricetes sp.]DAX71830.1 MAG TPA: RNA polymerase sigma factor [Caudoviricetes sp.]
MNEKDIEKLAEKVAEKLSNVKKIDKYKETEAMLRAYSNYKIAIGKNMERIKDIEKNGLKETNGKKFVENVQGGLKKYEGIPEVEIERIEHLKEENLKMEKRMIRVENALLHIYEDKYYDIIPLKYFKNYTIEEIADELNVDRRTIGRNRTRLIKELQYNLFPEILLD